MSPYGQRSRSKYASYAVFSGNTRWDSGRLVGKPRGSDFLAINRHETWNKIPDNIKPELMHPALKAEKTLRLETQKVEGKALEIMKQNGLVIHQVSPDAEKEWHTIADQGLNSIPGKSISMEIYKEVKGHVDEIRTQL